MSDVDLEAPEADATLQHLDVVPDTDAEDDNDKLGELAEAAEIPLEANEADATEQARIVGPDDDDYR